ncbi:MAG: zinc ribbon domain-containing protein [Dehalococcoidia bacterium]
MPIYEYRCQNCGEKFEKLVRSINGAEQVVCPGCQSESVERRLSAFATVGSSRAPNNSWPLSSTCTTGSCGL